MSFLLFDGVLLLESAFAAPLKSTQPKPMAAGILMLNSKESVCYTVDDDDYVVSQSASLLVVGVDTYYTSMWRRRNAYAYLLDQLIWIQNPKLTATDAADFFVLETLGTGKIFQRSKDARAKTFLHFTIRTV